MDDLILINSVEKRDALYSAIYRNVRELGVKLPKIKKVNKLNQSRRSLSVSGQQDERCNCKIFGESLFVIPTSYLPHYGYVPEFLVESCEIIDQHLECEGIFRKSGSLSRQKELRLAVDEGKPLEGANVFDTAVLIKQFFRELPEPLFLTVYLDAFIRCYQLPPDKDPKKAILQLCLLLPLENIGALRYIMHMLSRVAAMCDKNKMTANNLALIMAPNIMHNNKGTQKMSSSEEKLLHIQTYIVELLIKNWDHIGVVDHSLQHQMGMISDYIDTDDDLDASDDNTLEDSKDVSKKVRRKRSGSLTDLVSSIAHGLAKLRRSTDGKGGNMSLNSSQKGEVSIVSSQSSNQAQAIPADAVTPCVMRKRRASGDHVPFSTSKKQAILGNLPQKSALASTPFTPASTVRTNQDTKQNTLNATTPAMGSKTARKKLSLFISPGSKTKTKGLTSTSTTSESPPAIRSKSSKSKNIFKRLSGSRSEKISDRSGEFLPDEALPRSVSSPTLLDSDYRCSLAPSMSLVSSASCDTTTSLQSLLSTDSLLSLESRMSHDMSQSAPAINESPDSGKGSMLGEASYDSTVPSQFISQQSGSQTNCTTEEGVWVTCQTRIPDKSTVNNGHSLDQSHGLALLCENYTTTSDEEDSVDRSSRHKVQVSVDLEGINSMPKRTNISRKKSVSAEDLQSAQLKISVPVRVQSLCTFPSKSYNFKPHLQISKQTHNLLARAGYFRSTESDAKDVQVPVKSPKRSSYREEMMISLRSSFHGRHAHSNISFRSLRDFHNSSLSKENSSRSNNKDSTCQAVPNTSIHKHDTGLDVCASKFLSPLSEEKCFDLSQKDVMEAEVDVTGLDMSGTGCNTTDIDQVDVMNNVTEIDVDVTNNATDMDVMDNATEIEVGLTNSATDIEGTNNATDIEVDVTNADYEFEVNVPKYCTNSVVCLADNITSKDVHVTSSEESVAADIDPSTNRIDQNAVSQVHAGETGQVSASKHNLKDIKAALNLSGILDQEIINQVKIKGAEVLRQKRDSVLNVQHAGLVSQSIRQFSQHVSTEKDTKPIKPLIPKRGTSPIRIPTIFTKTHDLKSPAKDTNANIQPAFPAENIHENPMLQAAIKTPLKLLQPVTMKPLQTPSSARNQRPQIKRLRVQYSPRKMNHKSPKLSAAAKSPSRPL